MTYFLKSGTRYNVSTQAAMDLHDTLPVGTYTVKFNEMAGAFYLEEIEGFEVTGKIYGDTLKHSGRILQTFEKRTASTGVMLTGEKGSGKTLLAKMLAIDGQQLGYPTIVINNAWCGEEFNGFMQMIEQPVVVVFDEFEKVYNREDQEKMLTLLDGVYPSKKLFVITCNDKYRVNEHMKNRPGRIFYRLDYAGLETAFITEYCEDNLLNQSHIETITRIAMTFSQFNFDILKAMVEEMNRYDESPQEVMSILNAKPEQDDESRFDTVLTIGGKVISDDDNVHSQWSGNPLMGVIRLAYYSDKVDSDGDREYERVDFNVGDLQTIDAADGHMLFRNKKGDTLALTRVRKVEFNYNAF